VDGTIAISTLRNWYHHGVSPIVVLLTTGTTEVPAAEREARAHLTAELEEGLGDAGLSVVTVVVTDDLDPDPRARAETTARFAAALTHLVQKHRWNLQGIVGFAEGARAGVPTAVRLEHFRIALVALSPALGYREEHMGASWVALAAAHAKTHSPMLVVVGGCGPDIPRTGLAGRSGLMDFRLVVLMNYNERLIRVPGQACSASRGPYSSHSSDVPELVVDWVAGRVVYPE
jgi:hypothetical protein